MNITSDYDGGQFMVQRDVDKETQTSTGLWRWTATVGDKTFTGTEASQQAAINAAQEQCGIAPSARKTSFPAVAF